MRKRIFNRYSQMLEVRGNEALFDPYGTAEYRSEEAVFIISRQKGGNILHAIHNFSAKEVSLSTLNGSFKDILSGKDWNAKQKTVAPYGFAWLKKV